MTHRHLAAIAGLIFALAAQLAAQTPKPRIARTPDGHPDLQGVWTNATITPLERPAAFGDKLTLTDAEAVKLEKNAAEELAKVDGASEHPLLAAAGSNGTGGYNVLFIDRGSEFARIDGKKRTSLVVDPPDGHVPPMLPAARERNLAMGGGTGRTDLSRGDSRHPPACVGSSGVFSRGGTVEHVVLSAES